MAVPANSEDLIGQKFDKCLTDGVIKLGGGSVLGAVFSLLFFGRRRWPVLVGAGVGIGMAYASCEISLNELFKTSTFNSKASKINDPDSGEILLSKKEK